MGNTGRSAELDEIWSLFSQESKENLLAVEETLLKLEQDPADLEQVKVLFRALHSFKGAARMMGLSVTESMTHHAEDLIALVRDYGVALDRDIIDMVLTALDRMRAILDHVLANGCDVEPAQVQDVSAALLELIARKQPAEPSPEHAPGTNGNGNGNGNGSGNGNGNGKDNAVEWAEPALIESPATLMQDPLPVAVAEEPPAEPEPLPVATPQAPAPVVDAAVAPPPADAGSGVPIGTATEMTNFLRFVQDALGKLHAAQDEYASGHDQALQDIQAGIQKLRSATELMGYQRLLTVLEGFAAEAQETSSAGSREARIVRFQKHEMAVFEELTQIQDTIASAGMAEAPGWQDITWLFRHWNAERVFADLARLSELAEELERSSREFTMGATTTGQIEKLAEEATGLLRAIYHSCIFYHIAPAVHWTLALQDVYARIMQGEFGVPEPLAVLSKAYVTNLGSMIEAVREGESPNAQAVANLIEQTENILYLQTDGPVFQVTRGLLDVLNLPADFKDVMTPETLTQFSRALQAGEHFYTVLADLELDEEIGAAFLMWSRAPSIHLITSITVYRYERTLFNFLMSTTRPREELLESLKKIDPEWRYLTLQVCTLKQEADLEAQRGKSTASHVDLHADAPGRTSNGVSNEVLEDLQETVGVLVEDHATLRRVTTRLIDTEWVDEIMRVTQEAKEDPARLQQGLRDLMIGWTDSVEALHQMEARMGPTLSRLEEAARSLRLAPANDMLFPLRRMVQELAARQGKLVELDLQGCDLKIDRNAIQVLTEPVRRLVWFAVTHSIENVEQRKLVGKPTTGHMVVRVSTHENHAQVVVTDDGRGIDRERVRARARQLGWSDAASTTSGELDVVLRPWFGPVDSDSGAEGVDLAAINADMRGHQGRLSVVSESTKGTQFELRLPLEIAVVDGMVVRVGAVRYVLPVNAIRRIMNVAAEELVHSSAEGDQTFLRFEEELVVVSALAGQDGHARRAGLMAVVETEKGCVAIAIDELIGRQQVLVRPLPGQLADIRNASGARLGEGEVGILLDRSMNWYRPTTEAPRRESQETKGAEAEGTPAATPPAPRRNSRRRKRKPA